MARKKTISRAKRAGWGAAAGGVIGGATGIILALPTGETAAPVTVPEGIIIGSAAGASVGAEIEQLTNEASKLMAVAGKEANKNLRAIQKALKTHKRKHGKKNPNLAEFINSWVKEIDKRLKMGAKSYRKVMRQYKKSTHIRKHLRRREEKML